jgi:xanthine dehydrogenase accessory factor
MALARYNNPFANCLIVVRGGGDLASGAIFRLHKAGFPVVVLELETPLLVRRAVSFGDAVFCGTRIVQGVTARHTSPENVHASVESGEIAVLVDERGESLDRLRPLVVVDARMEKRNLGTSRNDAPVVIGLGPGFEAGSDCHAVIETNRGHDLGRAIYVGCAEADTGEPGSIGSHTHTRVLRAPTDGHVIAQADIGDVVQVGNLIAKVNDQPVIAPFTGMLRGIMHERVCAAEGMKIGDLDPRVRREHCFTISDKSLAVGGGVLEAALFLLRNVRS